MDASTERLNAIQAVTKHFLNSGDHKYALMSSEMALTTNPVDTISMIHKSVAHFKRKNYKQCLYYFQNAIQNSDRTSLPEIEKIMDEFSISSQIIVHETFLEVDRKIKSKFMAKITAMLLTTVILFIFYSYFFK